MLNGFDDFDTQVQADEFAGFDMLDGFEDEEDDELIETLTFEDEEAAVAYWLGR